MLGVDSEGAFVPPRGVSREEIARATEGIAARRARGAVSVEEVRRAGEVLTAADRSGFAVAAEAAQQGDVAQAQRHFERTASTQIAGAPAVDSHEREAATTIASASPQVVQTAFAEDYRSFGREAEAPTRRYDPRLMDQHGGLDRFREEAQAKEREAGKRPGGDEGLPF